jgi:Raf kinase inhibitor-like YbhB/YbcL family protein
MYLNSSAFMDGASIPKKYARDAENINPPLSWKNVPQGTKSFALVVEDPDVPAAAGVPVWDHWIVWNIPPHIEQIPEAWDVQGIRGVGTRGELVYGGPRPPDREHRYYFRLYALDALLDLPEGSTKAQLHESMRGHILAEAVLMGRMAP